MTKDPVSEVSVNNRWYTDDQFACQLGTPAAQAVVEGRWRVFESALCRRLVRRTDEKTRPLRVLDVGCGDGINLFGLSRILSARSTSANLYGVDYNPLRLGRASDVEGVQGLVRASVTDLPFNDDCFGVVLCNHVIEHVPNDRCAMGELHRILAKDGLLILGVPNEGCLTAQLRNNWIQPSIARTTDHVNFYTAQTLRSLISEAGFTVGEIQREGYFLPHLSLNIRIGAYAIGRAVLDMLRLVFPSQAAGLIVIATKTL